VNAAATATRSLVTLGLWAEPWEVWAVADEDRPYYEGGFLAARVGWELLPTYGVGKLTQVPGQVGRWGRYALYWDTAQNAVRVCCGGYDIYENGLNWANGLQVGTGLLGLGGNYTTWRRLPGNTLDAKGVFPARPDDLTEQLGVQPTKVTMTKDGTVRIEWEPSANTRIRYESHPEGLKPGDPGYNPRHHGEHYHVEIKPDGISWNQAKKKGLIVKIKPRGYTPGSGTGFLPNEPFPGL
jgi:hypothetical protein